MSTPRAACGVTPQGAALAAWQSQFRGALDTDAHAGNGQATSEGKWFQDAVEPALPGHTHRPLGGDAAGGAGGVKQTYS